MADAAAHPEPLTERYLSLVDRYARFATDAGKKIRRATPAEARRLFEKNDETRRRAVIRRLEVDLEIFAEMAAAGETLTDSRKLLWRHFGKSGYAPRSDIFDKIRDTDVVELYGLDQIHLCQSLSFFDWISHTLEQVFCEPWYALTRRDPAIQQSIALVAQKVISGEIRETVDPAIPWHLIEELHSTELNKFHLRVKYLSPVFSGGQLCSLVAVNECRS